MSKRDFGLNHIDVAECGQIDNLYSESQAYLRQALQAARMVAWEWNVVNDTVVHSSTSVDVLGMSNFLNVSAQKAFASIHPEDIAQHLATVKAAGTFQGSYKSQFRWIRPDTGEIIWLEDRGNVQYDSDGNITKINGVAMDISERKRTEATLQSASDKIHIILSSITDAFVALDHEWRYVYVNQAAEQVLQLPKDILLGRSLWELFPAEVENNTKTYQELHRAVAQQVPVKYEEFSPSLNFWVEVNAYPSVDGLAVYFRNVSDRKQAEAALHESNERFRLATLAVNGIVFEWNTQTDMVYRSEGLFQLVGVRNTIAPPTRKWWMERLHPDDIPRLEAVNYSVLSTGSNRYEAEYRVRHEDGRWIDVWERGCIVRDTNGEITGFVGFTTDISERKKSEAALQYRAEQIRMAQLLAKAGLWDWHIPTNQVTWSEEYYQLFGIDLEKAPSYENWLETVIEEDRSRADFEVRLTLEKHVPLNVEFRSIHPTHGLRWFAAIGDTINDAQGNPVRMLGISIDITKRKQIEEQEQAARIPDRLEYFAFCQYIYMHK